MSSKYMFYYNTCTYFFANVFTFKTCFGIILSSIKRRLLHTMDMNWLLTRPIAHRGLWDCTCPENSLGSYQNAIDKNYNIEIDVHLLPDGDFAVFHDDDLKRMCGEDIRIDALKADQLKNYKLMGTQYYIPTLREVLDLVNGQIGLLIEMKDRNNKNSASEKLIDYIKNYSGNYAIQSFGKGALEYWRKNTTEIPLGILSTPPLNFALPFWKKSVNPDFHSFNILFLPNIYLRRRQSKGVKLLSWTIRSKKLFNKAKRVGVDNIIFEGIRPDSYR